VVASSFDAVLTKSPDGLITSWNAAAEELYGYPARDAIGRPISILVPPDRHGEELEIIRRVVAGERLDAYATERIRRDGRRIEVSLSASPVRDQAGAIVEVSVIARDITRLRRMERHRQRLQTVSAALSQARSAAEVLDVVLRDGYAAVDADAVVVVQPDGGDRLEVVGVRGYGADAARRLHDLRRDDPLPVTDALRTGRPVWLTGAREVLDRYPQVEPFGVDTSTSLAALPLVVEGRTVAALGLRFSRSDPIDEDERRLMVALAQQCAQALERARLYEAEVEARRRAEYLARAGAVLGASLGVHATLEQIARLAVPGIADWAFVELLGEDGVIRREVIAHRDPEKERWARELAERYPLDPDAPYGSAKVIRTGEPELVSEITDELLHAAGIDDERARLLRSIGFTSHMVVPLRARGRVLGDIALASAESGRRYGPDDLAMAQQLADRCALALDNARLFAERAYIAKTLQEGLLPTDLPDIPHVELAVRYRAATRETDVGGDFYDVFASHGGWVFVAGDVVGRGAKAAAITGLARHTLRAAAHYERSPTAMLRVLNRAMRDEFSDPEQFCTVAVAHLRGHDLHIATGGHPLPLVLRAGGEVHSAGRPGTIIGVLEEPVLHEESVELDAGDTVLLYTDGITDAHGPDGRLGPERLAAMLALCLGSSPAQAVQRIDRAVTAYRSGEAADDSALLALRLDPAP
jgi:PAS domain S-box-containing protein